MRFEYLQCVSVQVTSLRGQLLEVSSLFQLRVLETELMLSGLHGKSMSVRTGIWEEVRKVESPTWDRLCRSTALRSSVFYTAFGPMGNRQELWSIQLSYCQYGVARRWPAPEGTSLKTVEVVTPLFRAHSEVLLVC